MSQESSPTTNGFAQNGLDGHRSRQQSQQSSDEVESSDEVTPLRDSSSVGSSFGQSIPGDSLVGPPPAPSSSFGSASPSTTSPHPYSNFPQTRSRGSSSQTLNGIDTQFANGSTTPKSTRPGPTRMPSHAYAPPRRPSQFALNLANQTRSSSASRSSRLNPDADYKAQKKLYAQRLQQDNAEDLQPVSPDEYAQSVGYSDQSGDEEESPLTADYGENDPYDNEQEAIMFYGNEDSQLSMEDLKNPDNRERLEWHSMLASVLTGDVVKQEKKRIIGAPDQASSVAMKTELWTGVKARTCGRTVPTQKRMIEEQRGKIVNMIEEVVSFEIQGEADVGKAARDQVEDAVNKIEKIESLYPTRAALEQAHPRAASDEFKESCDALISWHNTTELINIELGVLQSWVGNDELDFAKSNKSEHDGNLADESSFVERILKEDGLKSLQGENSIIHGVDKVIHKSKQTLIHNAKFFHSKHLPPYIEELLTLINFPSRLVQEIIRMRLSYAKKMRDAAQQGLLLTEQLITQFQILLELAERIKQMYLITSAPQPGWDLPPCIDENFDGVVLDALRFYIKMLTWKLSANKNTFKEAEILEQEWGFSSRLGRHFQGGDVQVAEEFAKLTSKSINRLTMHFEKELQRRPDEVAGPDMDRRYKQMLDSVRVRQRKLFRFSRLLSQTFENATELAVSSEDDQLEQLHNSLLETGHILINPLSGSNDRLYIFAAPSLQNQPREVTMLMEAAYRIDAPDDKEPYLLILCLEAPFSWDGDRMNVEMRLPKLDVKPGKLRVVAQGAEKLLTNAVDIFLDTIGLEFDVVTPQCANLAGVDKHLHFIRKKTYDLSNTIMDSVEIIRKQLADVECEELIQTCFAFATEFGQRSVIYMDRNRRMLNNQRLARLSLDWISFICDDCKAAERRTFRWAVQALEFAMMRTWGQNILLLSPQEYAKLRTKVSGCMSLLISHFDIMGARSTAAAQAEKQRESLIGKFKLDVSKLKNDEESADLVRQQWLDQLDLLDAQRLEKETEFRAFGRVLEGSTEADRSLTWLSASATNVTLRWQQGQYIGGGTFGSVWVATNIDTGHLMAVKEIRLQDPQMIPMIVGQIRDEISVLQNLSHPNIVTYHGIEVHRDKVYIFMEYCSGGSLAALLEHGRIEDETVISVYALQLLEGLAYLHESSVIHRDIKPENILLDHNGVLKYVDFGAAKIIAKQSGRTLAPAGPGEKPASNAVAAAGRGRQKSMTGTPMYMSPEVIRGTSSLPGAAGSPTSTPRPGAVDTWSLGCVILEMATGRRPWASLDNEWAIMYNIAQGNTPQLPASDQLSDQGIDFLKKCFERDPSKRASAVELLQHEWMMTLRNQLNLEPTTSGVQTPQTPSEGSGLSNPTGHASRQNSMVSN
ncbi:MAG: hypothetical protein Q9162_003684 [Coniocarpon cinnabarinum]